MSVNNTDTEKLRSERKRKKTWTKKRIRRYAKAYFFRLLFGLIILAAVLLVIRGVKLVVNTVTGAGGEKTVQEQEVILPETLPPETETGESPAETDVPESETGMPDSLGAADPMSVTAAAETVDPNAPPKRISRITISAAGDCTLGTTQSQGYSGSFHEYYDNNGPAYFLEGVKDIFTGDDLTLVNLECVLTEETRKVKKTYNLKGKPEYTRILTSASVEAVSLGNNHNADYGEQSLADTKTNLDLAGVKWAVDTEVGYYETAEGLKVAIVSKEMMPATKAKKKEMLEAVNTAREAGANLVIACCHWGAEKDYTANSAQISLAHALIDEGADLVIGNHPHVLQGLELYKGKMICYSLGNFSFGGNRKPSDFDTMIYRQTFTLHDGVVQPDLDANVIPCSVSSTANRNDFRPRVVAEERKASIIKKLNKYTKKLGKLVVDDKGVIYDSSVPRETEAETVTGETAGELPPSSGESEGALPAA